MVVTEEFLRTGMTNRLGIKNRQFKVLGIEKPYKGWMKDLIGREIPDETAQEYLVLGKQTDKVIPLDNKAGGQERRTPVKIALTVNELLLEIEKLYFLKFNKRLRFGTLADGGEAICKALGLDNYTSSRAYKNIAKAFYEYSGNIERNTANNYLPKSGKFYTVTIVSAYDKAAIIAIPKAIERYKAETGIELQDKNIRALGKKIFGFYGINVSGIQVKHHAYHMLVINYAQGKTIAIKEHYAMPAPKKKKQKTGKTNKNIFGERVRLDINRPKDYRAAVIEFYQSKAWRELRVDVLEKQHGTCQICGRTRKHGVILHVDHITPLSVNWSRRLDPDNLQVLCDDCNIGKSNRYSTDWR
jgi:hypothetical protein